MGVLVVDGENPSVSAGGSGNIQMKEDSCFEAEGRRRKRRRKRMKIRKKRIRRRIRVKRRRRRLWVVFENGILHVRKKSDEEGNG